jgi:hypothetical protein
MMVSFCLAALAAKLFCALSRASPHPGADRCAIMSGSPFTSAHLEFRPIGARGLEPDTTNPNES